MPTPNWARAVIGLFAGVILLIAAVTGDSLDRNFLRWLSIATSAVVLLLLIYEKWAWRWPLIRKGAEWAGRPIIHGTWKGELEFESDQHRRRGTIPFYMAIDQTFSAVRIRSFAETTESYSLTATIERPAPTRRQLVLAYHSEPPHDARDDNRPHDGTCMLSLVGIPVEEITGSYYNDRMRRGSIRLTEHTKVVAESFAHAQRQTYKQLTR
jgi:hypothetical protein